MHPGRRWFRAPVLPPPADKSRYADAEQRQRQHETYGRLYAGTGVFLADFPMTIDEGAKGDQVLRVELPDDVDLGKFDFTDAANPSYREWRVPAALINEHTTVTLITDDELWDMGANIWRGYDDPNPPGTKPRRQIRTPPTPAAAAGLC